MNFLLFVEQEKIFKGQSLGPLKTFVVLRTMPCLPSYGLEYGRSLVFAILLLH